MRRSTICLSVKSVSKKACAALAAACLLATMVPAAALAEVATLADEPSSGTVAVDENWTLAYTVEDGEATIDYAESYPDGTADLTIPATVPDPEGGDDVPVTGIGEGAFCGNSAYEAYYHEGADHLAKVTLSDSVRFIETRAFNSSSVTSISIGTDIAYVEQYGIASNAALEEVLFADDASPEYFADYAFQADSALEEFSVPPLTGYEYSANWSYRVGSSCFARCTSLETVVFQAGDPNKGSEYTLGDPSRPSGWFTDCPLSLVISYLEDLELNLGTYDYGAGSSSYAVYYALFFYETEEAAEEDPARENCRDCVLLREGTSLTDVAAGTVDESYYYGTERVPDVSDYTDDTDSVWGFGNDAVNSSDDPGMQDPNKMARALNSPLPVYPVSRADMNYAYISLGGARTVTTGSGIGRDEGTSSVYYLYTTGVDLSGIVACASDGKTIDSSLYDLIFSESEESQPPDMPFSITTYADGEDLPDSPGSYDVYAQGKGDYAETQTSSSTFKIEKHEASVTSYTSGTETRIAAETCYQTATELEDPAFVVMAPASDWHACMVATALAGAGRGLAVFSDGTADDDMMFQAILRSRVDHITFVGTTSAIGAAAIERAKILVNDDEGAFNYFDLSDPAALAADVCDKVAKSGPTSDNPHEWGDTAILMSQTSCLYTASISQYAYAAAAPVLYTKTDGSISTETKDAISRFDNVVVAGDAASVPASTVSTLESSGATVTRICEEGQAYASSTGVADLMETDCAASTSTVAVADATSPSCVMAAGQLAALEGGITYTCSSSAETKACQKALYETGRDSVNQIYVAGPFASDPSVSSRMERIWDDAGLTDADFAFVNGDTFEAGGLLYTRDSSSAATLTSVADASLTKVDASTATYENTAYTVDTLAATALSGNKNITSVTLGNVSSVPASALKNCTALKTASFSKATKMAASAFSGCFALTSVSIPKVVSIPAASFKGLKKLSSVTAGSAKTIGTGAFQNCTSLTSVKLPKVTSIPASAFAGDKKLKSASFGTVKTIGASAFTGCAALTSAPVAKATSIGASAFSGCSSIKTVKAASVKTIGANAFKGAKKLKTAKLTSKKLKNIGANAFSGCKKLKKVTIKSTKLKKVGKKAFKGCAKKMTVKVPKAKVAKYKKLLTKAGISRKAKVKA